VNQQSAVPCGELANLGEISGQGLFRTHGLHDDRGDLAEASFERRFERSRIVERERLDEPLNGFGKTEIVLACADIPILHSVIAAGQNQISATVRPCQLPRGSGGVRAVLYEAHHLGARNELRDQLRELDLERRWLREDDALTKLARDRRVDYGIGVAERYRSQREQVVDVAVAVDVPKSAAGAAFDKGWCRAFAVIAITLAVGLRCRRNPGFRTTQPFEAAGVVSHLLFPIWRSSSRLSLRPALRSRSEFSSRKSGRLRSRSRTSCMPKVWPSILSSVYTRRMKSKSAGSARVQRWAERSTAFARLPIRNSSGCV